jgi:hypothetical protein
LESHQEKSLLQVTGRQITVPKIFNYQGKLVDNDGKPVNDGSYVMIFRLYADTFQSPIWDETQVIITNNGLFSTYLGIKNPFDISIPSNCYLGIQVLPSQAEMRPYQKFASVPYAYFSDNTDKISGVNLPGLDDRFVNTAESASIISKMIKDSAITTTKIADTNVTMPKLQRFGAQNGQVLKWTNNGWLPRTDSASGSPIGPAGGDLIGEYPNPIITDSSVTGAKIKDNTISSADIRDTTIITADIKDGAVINNKIGDDQITSDKIFNNTIRREDVAANFRAPFADSADYVKNTFIDSTRIAVTAYNSHKIQGKDTVALSGKFVDEEQANSISSSMITDNAVNQNKIQDYSITNNDVSKQFSLIDTLLIGTSQIAVGDSQVEVQNRYVKNTSLIFLTMGPVEDSITTYIKVRRIIADSSFVVSTRSNKRTYMRIPFSYFIVPKR